MDIHEHKRKPKKLIILEGPDCAGKTTLMNELGRSMVDAIKVHHGPYPRLTSAQLPRFYVDSMAPLLGQYEHMLMDRCWLSEPIYGAAFRKGQDRVGIANRRHLERLAMRHGAVVVLCLPPWEKVKEAWLLRKGAASDAEYLDKVGELADVYDDYAQLHEQTDLPVVLYDYTRHKHQMSQLRQEIDRVSMLRHHSSGTAGNLNGRVILVGEKPSEPTDHDTLVQWPFGSFAVGGSSRWLTEQLDTAGISEADLLWLNAESGVYQIKDLYTRPVFALGNEASAALDRADIDHVKVPHPQAHKRFHSSEQYELIPLLQAALK